MIKLSNNFNYTLDTKWNDYPNNTLYLWNGYDLYKVQEGSGNDLTEEDYEDGYVDYWLSNYWLDTGHDDGGMWLEEKSIRELDYTLEEVIERMMACDLWDDDWEIITEEQVDKLMENF